MRMSIRTKLLGIVAGTTLLASAATAMTLVQLNSAVDTFSGPVAAADNAALHGSQLRSAFQSQHQDLKDLLLRGADKTNNDKYLTAFNADGAIVKTKLEQLQAEVKAIGDATAVSTLTTFTTDYATYTSAVAKALPKLTVAAFDQAGADAIVKGMDRAAQADLVTISTELSTSAADTTSSAISQAHTMATLLAILALAAILFAALLGYLISRAMARNIKRVLDLVLSVSANEITAVEAGLAAFAANDLTMPLSSSTKPVPRPGKDEVGQTAQAANEMLHELGSAIESYETARANLSRALRHVQATAESVASASTEMNSAATQTGNASGQIASTISQIASGASDQARASSSTASSVQSLADVATEVSTGAESTRDRVAAASAALEDMARAINDTSRAASEVAETTAGASTAADNGRLAVDQTVDGMARIKNAVDGVAVKVTELGAKSDQIGAIVETIDDIAEQTNLLALNAAIEAARAGEQGKGFAVVADEVRKLAERSSRATKEIAALISEVQRGTADAVEAMQVGAQEVETGSRLAARSGEALQEIAAAVGSARTAVSSIGTAVEAMHSSSTRVVEASDAIAVIASRTATSSERMKDATTSLSQAIESIAAISEENSASTEEVSAATEQLSAQAEEVTASAANLEILAAQLNGLVGGFHLDAGVDDQSDPRDGAPPRLRLAA